jgi:hypothetical protein
MYSRHGGACRFANQHVRPGTDLSSSVRVGGRDGQ